MSDDRVPETPDDDERADAFLQARLRERLDFLQSNGSPEATEEDALDDLVEACGQTRDGGCQLAGTEFCDFECSFRDN